MANTSQRRSVSRASVAAAASFAIVLAAGWILLVAGTRPHEMIVGAAVVLVTTVFLLFVRSERKAIDLQWKDLAQGWRIPWYMVSGMWEISIVFFKDVLLTKPAGSFYRVCGFKSSKRDPRIVAREVLATVYTTMAPNFIVIGIDPELSRMLFHQIERSSVPKMTQSLGAQ